MLHMDEGADKVGPDNQEIVDILFDKLWVQEGLKAASRLYEYAETEQLKGVETLLKPLFQKKNRAAAFATVTKAINTFREQGNRSLIQTCQDGGRVHQFLLDVSWNDTELGMAFGVLHKAEAHGLVDQRELWEASWDENLGCQGWHNVWTGEFSWSLPSSSPDDANSLHPMVPSAGG